MPKNSLIQFDVHKVVEALSLSLDLVGGTRGRPFSGHCRRVAYVSMAIARQMGVGPGDRGNLFYAAFLHDVGLASDEEFALLRYPDWQGVFDHAEAGYQLLKHCPSMEGLAGIIRHHHDRWNGGNPSGLNGRDIPLSSRIIHLADNLETRIRPDLSILAQSASILEALRGLAGKHFDPELVDCLRAASEPEAFWLALESPFLDELLDQEKPGIARDVSFVEFKQLARVFAALVDHKSPYTYRHSRGVAMVGSMLGAAMGFEDEDLEHLELAGLLHDLGKLSVPNRILNKPGRLDTDEMAIVKQHTYYTYGILAGIPGLERIAEWAALHHERLNGTGYPFRYGGARLSLGARIMAVSDTFQALTEDRPYRPGWDKEDALRKLEQDVADGLYDGDVVLTLRQHCDDILIATKGQRDALSVQPWQKA